MYEITPEEYLELAEKLESMQEFAVSAVDLFHSFECPDIQTEGDMLAMGAPNRYAVSDSRMARFIDAALSFDCDEVDRAIEEYSVNHSAALCARVRSTGKPYFTGALARINQSWQFLGRQAKLAAAKVGLRPPERNPFNNNVSQAVEIVDALERCAELCRRLANDEFEGSSEPVPFQVKAGFGVGFTEAPRGALFHELELDDEGRVVRASIITPTAQNVANLEADMRILAEKLVADGAAAEIC